MKKYLLKICFILSLSPILLSCTQVYFVEQQNFGGIQIDEFPIDMRGTWIEKKEGIRINSNSFESIKINKDSLDQTIDTSFQTNTMGDSLKIYQDRKMVFVNYRAESPYWQFAVLKKQNNGTIRIYDCRDANLIIKDKGIILKEALFEVNDSDTVVYSLNPSLEDGFRHKSTLFAGQLSKKSLRKMMKKEFLVCKLKKDGRIL